MRIRELLEGKNIDDFSEFVEQDKNKGGINYDLAEDLVHFMNQDDDIYRRHVYPIIAKCLKSKSNIDPSMFAPAVKESYKAYIKKFPIRELPDELDDKGLKETCTKMQEELSKHISDGKYKD
jgi:hypothetical protein